MSSFLTISYLTEVASFLSEVNQVMVLPNVDGNCGGRGGGGKGRVLPNAGGHGVERVLVFYLWVKTPFEFQILT